MRRKTEPTVVNVLSLLSKKVKEFSGQSLRSYQKAFSSFQVYALSNYGDDALLDQRLVENWVIDNLLHGLSLNTVKFYLDKISSLYSGIAIKLAGGKTPIFKEVKLKAKDLGNMPIYPSKVIKCVEKIRTLNTNFKESSLVETLKFPPFGKESLNYIWACLALNAGVRPDIINGVLGGSPQKLRLLDFCGGTQISSEELQRVCNTVADHIYGEEMQWFAMRLRPGVDFDQLMRRFFHLKNNLKMPELFYPCEEIARQTGRKVVWKGRPVIRDVVFFKSRKSDIYPMFTRLYDLAWCYKRPGTKPGNYAPIPEKAMEDFKRAIGVLTPDFDVTPAGEIPLKPGDEVIILDKNYLDEHGQIIKIGSPDIDGNKIYRVLLSNRLGKWDVGIDARLLKKAGQ